MFSHIYPKSSVKLVPFFQLLNTQEEVAKKSKELDGKTFYLESSEKKVKDMENEVKTLTNQMKHLTEDRFVLYSLGVLYNSYDNFGEHQKNNKV